MPLLNVLESTYCKYPVVIKVHYWYRHIVEGGKNYANYIAKISLPYMERLDLEKNRFDLFIVDVASNVRGAEEVVEAFFLGSILSTG